MSRSSSGRRSFAPEIPVSTYSPATVQPRRSQYSRNSRNCISGDWPLFDVLILAYRAVRVMLWAATLHLLCAIWLGAQSVLEHRRAPLLFLPFQLRLAASPFAVILLLVPANMLHVAVGPDAGFDISDPHFVRFCNLSVQKPALKSHLVNAEHPSRLRCGVRCMHCTTTNSIFILICQVLARHIHGL